MTPEFSPDLARELLDDFYTECDEQLGALRNHLAEIEGVSSTASSRSFEPLFRTMHSLKGNAAIVGLREAEDLAHSAEAFLKALTQGHAYMSETGLEALQQTVQRLELIIGAHRQKTVIPPVDDLVQCLKHIAVDTSGALPGQPGSGPGVATSPSPQASAAATENRPRAFRFTFSPSRELDDRGVNINTVRAHLASLGAIRSSQPVITGESMTFEFIVEMSNEPDPAEWQAEGVRFDRLDPSDPQPPTQKIVQTPTVSADGASTIPAADDHGTSLFIAPSHIMRVDISRLDDLLRIAGELVIHRSRLDDRLSQNEPDRNALKEVNLGLARSLRELHEAITRVRLVPVAEVFARLPFVLRDLARGSSKKARLLVEGKHTEIDKYVVERLKEPLLHLVRNAFSHGIETPDLRVAAGKPAEGSIVLSAAAEGGFVVIQIRDDGHGVDTAQIIARAKALNLPLPETLDDKAVLDILCASGFSTRDVTDRASGRGMGMSVVRDVVHELGGSLSLQTVPQQSTQFTLRLPLTLSILDTILLSVSGQICAMPQNVVQEIVEVRNDAIRSIKQTQVMPYRDGVLPVVRLAKLFGSGPTVSQPAHPVLVIRTDDGFAGLIVDRVIGQREVVVRPMDDPLIQARGIAGATELGDGRPVLILDALELLQGAVRPLPATERAPSHTSCPLS